MAARRSVYQIEGLRELEHALKELPRATGKNTLNRALKKAAAPIADTAAALAPRDTGNLAESIKITTRLSRRQKAQHFRQSAVEIFAGAAAMPHAHLQEFGTAHHAAQPFFRPAWDSKKQAALETVKDILAKEIEASRKRLAKKAEREAAKMKIGA